MDEVTRQDGGQRARRFLRPRCRCAVLLLLAVSLDLGLPRKCAAAEEAPEYHVKAAFLLNFTKFVDWPAGAFAGADSPIDICILGDDPFGKVLDQMVADEVVGGRRLTAHRIKQLPPPKLCQVVFGGKSGKELVKILPALGPGVLTVGEGEGFIHEGGMIAFVIENRRVRFEINQRAAANAGIRLSSRLLSVAKSVD